MSSLTRDLILSSRRAPEAVHVPEWGGDVYIKTMSARDRLSFEAAVKSNPELVLAPTLLAFTLCDEEGKLLFAQGDVDALHDQPWGVLSRLYQHAARLNALKAEDVEAAEGESQTGPSS